MGRDGHEVLLGCWWAGLVLLVVGVPAITLGLTRFARRGTEVQGTVSEVLLLPRRGGAGALVPVVRFTDAASEREVIGSPSCGRVPLAGWPGQPITVRYLPSAPERFQAGPQTSVFDAALSSLLVMTLGSVALVLTRWTDPDAIATSAVLGASGVALGAATVLTRRASRSERCTALRDKGVVSYGRIVGSLVVDGGGDNAHHYHPVLAFTSAAGEEVLGADLQTMSSQSYPVDGAPVPVRHLPENPLLFALDATVRRRSATTGPAARMFGLVTVLACCGVLIMVGANLGHR
ncbi:DUF3592 domain-containing protein [Kitasatospora sp. NBC_01250]|uniref:DUF3592 domain-containing protein n=1 Tax=unclassified Kitasatospora TaxID=2633591 RepID=UPI002E11576D|nr:MULTISPECIES: DUF3592 domain-containing protein [unclassified Kitasatospora]WSJ68568.1 DUF3592 domain-containing protein [Kitasatospora sp. NBC_01302]